MARKQRSGNADYLVRSESEADWEAQGWASEATPIEAAPRLEATVSIRFDPAGAALLRSAARLKGITKSEFIRRATLQEAQRTIDETSVPITMWLKGHTETGVETHGVDLPGIHTVIRQPASTTTTRRAVEIARK
jgi:hypothetical protein